MNNNKFLENTEIVYGKWIEYVPDNIFRKIMRMFRKTWQLLKELKRLLLIGTGITLGMLIIWLVLFLGTVSANGPDIKGDIPIPFLINNHTELIGDNPAYYPEFQDTIYLITDIPIRDYTFGLDNVTGCYQLTWQKQYGNDYVTNVGYRIIYDVQGLSALVSDLDNISTCHGSRIHEVSYNKLESGIHQ